MFGISRDHNLHSRCLLGDRTGLGVFLGLAGITICFLDARRQDWPRGVFGISRDHNLILDAYS